MRIFDVLKTLFSVAICCLIVFLVWFLVIKIREDQAERFLRKVSSAYMVNQMIEDANEDFVKRVSIAENKKPGGGIKSFSATVSMDFTGTQKTQEYTRGYFVNTTNAATDDCYYSIYVRVKRR